MERRHDVKRSWYLLLIPLVWLTLAAPRASALVPAVNCLTAPPPGCGTGMSGYLGGVPLVYTFLASPDPFEPVTTPLSASLLGGTLTMDGFVTYDADPWFSYDLTFTNSNTSPETIDLLWTPDAAGAPFYFGTTSLLVDVTQGGVVPDSGPMQTVTFPGSAPLQLGTVPCAGVCGPSYANVSWLPFGTSFTSYTVSLDFELGPNSSAEFQGFAGLDTPEPGGVQLLGIGLLALGLGWRRLRLL